MPNIPDYVCTSCGARTEKEGLTVKRAQFVKMGEGGRTIRSRVTEWLCNNCLDRDEDWNRPKAGSNAS